jgi:hypothetical protein
MARTKKETKTTENQERKGTPITVDEILEFTNPKEARKLKLGLIPRILEPIKLDNKDQWYYFLITKNILNQLTCKDDTKEFFMEFNFAAELYQIAIRDKIVKKPKRVVRPLKKLEQALEQQIIEERFES